MNNTEKMTTSEWEVMRIVWTLGQATSREITDILQRKHSWQPSTIKTLIARLEHKGYLQHNGAVRDRHYQSTITEDVAMKSILMDTLNAICAMHIGATLADIIKDITLSQTDIIHLEVLLADKKQTAPQTVACNCLSIERKC